MALLALPGCRPSAAPSGPLAIVVSGDTAGWIVPCGCVSNQSGGLPRRATYLAEVRSESAVLAADAGGAPGGRSAYDRMKFEAILRGEQAMGVVAHNIGAAEAAMGPKFLREAAQRTGAALVSANLSDDEGQPLAEPLVIGEAAGRRVAFIGVLSPRYASPGVHAVPPREAVLGALTKAAGRCDAVVVLAYLPEEELLALAEALPEADAVVGGPTGQPLAPRRAGPTMVTSATRQGKFVVRLDASPPRSGEPWSGQITELSDRFADDAEQLAVVARFRKELAEADLTPADTSWAQSLPAQAPAGFAVAGSESCGKCHAEDARRWNKSRHAKAWQSLVEKAAAADPDCQRCHTTGYGLPGGFVSARRSPRLVHVGCESCHGPSLGHAGDPKVPTAHAREAKHQCIVCHDQENSPKFAYDAYWSRIRHGIKEKGDER